MYTKLSIDDNDTGIGTTLNGIYTQILTQNFNTINLFILTERYLEFMMVLGISHWNSRLNQMVCPRPTAAPVALSHVRALLGYI